MADRNPDDTNFPPFETEDLRANLAAFIATPFNDPILGRARPVGSFTWGVYAFSTTTANRSTSARPKRKSALGFGGT